MKINKSNSVQKLHFSTRIIAPKGKVWDTMLNDESYRKWTSAFTEGSHYKGSWEKGSKILFLIPNGQGMVSRIAENKLHEFISLELLGFVKDGKEDTESEEAKAMAGAHENYTFKESDGSTEVLVDMDSNGEYKALFEEAWPKALLKLKELSEK